MNIQYFDYQSLERGVKQIVPLEVTSLPDGNPLRLQAMCVTGREAGPLVVVLAGIHGDEYEGILSVPEIYARLEPASLRGTVICVPVCNVPAFMTATRSSPIDGANMARVFPGDANGTITQRIAYWLGERIMRHADLITDLHSAGVAYNLPMLIGYYRPANDVGKRTQALAEAFGADVVWAHPDIAPGRTMSFAAEHNIPGLYTEAPGGGRVRPEDFTTMVEGVLNCLQAMGMIGGRAPVKRAAHHLFGSGDLDHIINASAAGIFVARTHLLADVRKGDVLGEVRAVTGQMLETLYAPVEGVIITMRGLLRVNAGDGLFALAVRE